MRCGDGAEVFEEPGAQALVGGVKVACALGGVGVQCFGGGWGLAVGGGCCFGEEVLVGEGRGRSAAGFGLGVDCRRCEKLPFREGMGRELKGCGEGSAIMEEGSEQHRAYVGKLHVGVWIASR